MTRPVDGTRPSFESILRTGLEPDAATASRIVAKALSARRPNVPSLRLLFAAAALVALAIWTAGERPPQAQPTTLTSGPGGIVVVRTAHGGVGLYQNAQPAQTVRLMIRQGGSS
jgi:hypothetical protein